MQIASTFKVSKKTTKDTSQINCPPQIEESQKPIGTDWNTKVHPVTKDIATPPGPKS